jgi:hypothetical protein
VLTNKAAGRKACKYDQEHKGGGAGKFVVTLPDKNSKHQEHAHAVLRKKSLPKAARNIWDARATKTSTNSSRILSLEMDMRKWAPRIAPTTEPKATGPAIGATI